MKIIFLDIDGVLNNHQFNEVAGSCIIQQDSVQCLNSIMHLTGAKIVVSSAWRYMRTGGRRGIPSMTDDGFKYMMQTHGLMKDSIIGFTELDSFCVPCKTKLQKFGYPKYNFKMQIKYCKPCSQMRATQVIEWLDKTHFHGGFKSKELIKSLIVNKDFIVIDDLDLGFRAKKLPFWQTNPETGLVISDIASICTILGVKI